MAKNVRITCVATLRADFDSWDFAVESPPKGCDAHSLLDGMATMCTGLHSAADQIIEQCAPESTAEARLAMFQKKVAEQIAAGVVESNGVVRKVE